MKRALELTLLLVLPAPAWAITESERDTNFEIKLGGYTPEIDEEFEVTDANRSTAPYERVFGGESDTMFMLIYERHLWQQVGTLSGGVGIGYWDIESKAVPAAGLLVTTADKTGMTIIPMLAQLSYRFDWFADRLPLAPIARIGIDYYAWDITGGDGETARFNGTDEASGGTWGWHYALGVQLLLDYIDPEMAADFDRDAGVNSSYLTFEYHRATVDDFGSGDSFRLGDGALLFGIALDM